MERKVRRRYFGVSLGPQTQFQKSWEVAIGTGIIPEKPIEAVLERITLPAGSNSAAEFAIPTLANQFASLFLGMSDAHREAARRRTG